jgi:hypothetical protein
VPGGKGTPGASPPSNSQVSCANVLSQAALDAETAACVNSLSANAQIVGCFFEDETGKREDLRTGMTCPDRQAALAKQCRAKCAQFSEVYHRQLCDPLAVKDEFWKATFGDIGGTTYGSAKVQACGPPLKSVDVRALPRTDSRDQKYLDLKKK